MSRNRDFARSGDLRKGFKGIKNIVFFYTFAFHSRGMDKWFKYVWLVLGGLLLSNCTDLRQYFIKAFSTPNSEKTKVLRPSTAVFQGKDKDRNKLAVRLTAVCKSFYQPTDIQFYPPDPQRMVVLGKTGQVQWCDQVTKESGLILNLNVLKASEQGVLGLAFHPNFSSNYNFYLNTTVYSSKGDVTRISEWTLDRNSFRARGERILLEVVQPYANHNAGQLIFGPDGYLYIGLGDGGWANDPHLNGQNTKTFLGSMLRIDVRASSSGKSYRIPPDNPFVKNSNYLPEIWAFGLRNPWRYSFSPDNRLIVADVGQNLFEEVSIVERGENHGWNIKEGFHCFSPKKNCSKKGLTEPIWEYGRDEGISITGGYVYTGKAIPKLKNKYIFGDYDSGRIWALDLPPKGSKQSVDDVFTLGKWPIRISTFGRAPNGEVYVAAFLSGQIYRLEP